MKLFRRLAGKAPRPDSFFSYLKYAFGEIVLVVVGILIAVSLNNWNEDRKTAAALDQLLATVQADINSDLEEMRAAREFYDVRKPIYEKVLAGDLTEEDYREQKGIAYLIIGFPEVNLHTRGFDLLNKFDGTIPPNRRELVGRIIVFYTDRIREIGVDDRMRSDDFDANFNFFKTTKPWWSAFIHDANIDGFIPYAVNDPDYRNRVATSYFISYRGYLPELDTYQEKADVILADIAAALAE